jgi:hydrogenase-4 component E
MNDSIYLSDMGLAAAAAALVAVWMCGVTRVRAQVRGLALQTVAMSAVCVFVGIREQDWHYYLLAAVVLGIKAIGIPVFLDWAARRLDVRRDAGAFVSAAVALALGCAILVVGLLIGKELAVPELNAAGAAGMAVALLLLGMFLMLTRRLAISQMIGLLTMENGILLYSLTQTRGMPMIVEMAVVFEILMGVLVAGLVFFRLNRSFEHIDVAGLRRLRR